MYTTFTNSLHHIEMHLAPLTTFFLSIQDAPGSSPAAPLDRFYLSIQVESALQYGLGP
jgi:hypothetical protein